MKPYGSFIVLLEWKAVDQNQMASRNKFDEYDPKTLVKTLTKADGTLEVQVGFHGPKKIQLTIIYGGPVGSVRYEFQGSEFVRRKWLASHRLATEYAKFSRKQETSE